MDHSKYEDVLKERSLLVHKPTLILGKFTLKIVCQSMLPSLADIFYEKGLHDSDMYEYIKNNPEDSFYKSIHKYGDNNYYLNCASTLRDLYGDFSIEFKKEIVEIYSPIIRKFMIDVLSDNLYIMEDGKLVKQ